MGGEGFRETLGQKFASLMFFNMQGNSRLWGSEMAAHMPSLALLAKNWSFGNVVEVGVGQGYSTCAFVAGLEGTGRGLISYDINPLVNQSFWKVMGLPGPCKEIDWEFRVKDSVSAAMDFYDKEVSLLFIDTSHIYEATVAELEAWEPKMHPRGVICGHDYYLERMGDVECGVKRAVDEFHQKRASLYTLQVLPHDQGLFILWPK